MIVEFTLDAKGHASDPKVIESNPAKVFDGAAHAGRSTRSLRHQRAGRVRRIAACATADCLQTHRQAARGVSMARLSPDSSRSMVTNRRRRGLHRRPGAVAVYRRAPRRAAAVRLLRAAARLQSDCATAIPALRTDAHPARTGDAKHTWATHCAPSPPAARPATYRTPILRSPCPEADWLRALTPPPLFASANARWQPLDCGLARLEQMRVR